MRKLSLREIQQTELALMTAFDRVARAHGLRYSLSAGTLLGAVRHEGFIPWDDDIDISMPRPDYEKLLILNREQSLWPAHITLKSGEDGSLEVPFCKIFDTRTKIIEKNFAQPESQALWIDIFPVDGLPDDERERERLYRKALNLCRLNVTAATRGGYGRNAAMVVLRTLFLKPAARILGRERLSRKLRELAMKHPYEDARLCGMVTWAFDGPGQALTKEEFEDLVELPFEGQRFLSTAAWEKYLTGVFGDYRKLPPEEERLTHEMEAFLLEEEDGDGTR